MLILLSTSATMVLSEAEGVELSESSSCTCISLSSTPHKTQLALAEAATGACWGEEQYKNAYHDNLLWIEAATLGVSTLRRAAA